MFTVDGAICSLGREAEKQKSCNASGSLYKRKQMFTVDGAICSLGREAEK
jgi:hypothetical protein